ncbi:MAG: anthranilate synthase component I, partial [Proteobacteria bacterium]|nr:anthranilate synthase component I [Pseudomonadota bacterium]
MKKSCYYPNLEKFKELSGTGNIVPVYREILADTDTPVSALMKISAGENAFLFESVEGGEKWGRYSLLGTAPRMTLKSRGRKVEITEDGEKREVEGDPIEVLREIMARYKAVEIEGVARFSGGAIGYMGYDTIRHIERLPDLSPKDL